MILTSVRRHGAVKGQTGIKSGACAGGRHGHLCRIYPLPERSGGQPRRDDVAGELRGVPARMGSGRRLGLPRGESLFPSLVGLLTRNRASPSANNIPLLLSARFSYSRNGFTTPMPLKSVSSEATRNVHLLWTRPEPYEQIISDGSIHDANGWLYMILGYFGASGPKLFYIGKVYQNCVSARLRQADHKRRYTRLRAEHPRHRFEVSLAAVQIDNRRITHRGIDQIETMLIYTAKESQPLINERKWLSHRISASYHIRNRGHCRPLPKEIRLGIFTS